MLAKKIVAAIARGDLCFISRIGITGDTATLVSTIRKINPQTPLADMRLHMSECDQGSPSIDLRDKPSSRHPTVRTRVNDPKKSIRLSLVRRVKDRTSSGSGMSTLTKTSVIDSTRIGTCNRFQVSAWCLGGKSIRAHLEQKRRSPDRGKLDYHSRIAQRIDIPTEPVVEPSSQWSTETGASGKDTRRGIGKRVCSG